MKLTPSSEDTFLADQLRVLGAEVTHLSAHDIIYAALVKMWKGRRGLPPTIREIYTACPALKPQSIRTWLPEMVERGLVIRPSRGVYVPVVAPRRK